MGRRWLPALCCVSAACGRLDFAVQVDASATDTNISPDAFEPPGLIAHWKFDETTGTTAADSSGNGHVAMLQGSASWGTGVIGGALVLDGATGYAIVPQTSQLDLATTPYSISLWLTDDSPPATLGTSTWHRAIAWLDASGYDHSIGLATNAAVTQRVLFGANLRGGTARVEVTTGDLTTGWHHVVTTFDGTNSSLFVDGVAVGGGGLSNGVTNGIDAANVYIGQKGDNTRSRSTTCASTVGSSQRARSRRSTQMPAPASRGVRARRDGWTARGSVLRSANRMIRSTRTPRDARRGAEHLRRSRIPPSRPARSRS
jgi:hypothetical protein